MKQSGLGDRLFVAGFDLSGDISAVQRVAGGPAALEVTGIDKSAPERIGGLRDGGIDFTAWFNDAAGQSHPVLSTLPTTDRIVSYFRGAAIGSPTASCVAKQVNYDGTRAQDGTLTHTVNAVPNGYGVEWGLQLTAGKRTDSTATNGASIDYGAVSTAFGLQAWLHVFAFTGTSVTVTIQDSADNISFANVSGAVFTAATGVTSERIAVSGTVRRYLRAITTGTFSNAVFAVQVTRNETLVVF
jgi:hypothetical protein